MPYIIAIRMCGLLLYIIDCGRCKFLIIWYKCAHKVNRRYNCKVFSMYLYIHDLFWKIFASNWWTSVFNRQLTILQLNSCLSNSFMNLLMTGFSRSSSFHRRPTSTSCKNVWKLNKSFTNVAFIVIANLQCKILLVKLYLNYCLNFKTHVCIFKSKYKILS